MSHCVCSPTTSPLPCLTCGAGLPGSPPVASEVVTVEAQYVSAEYVQGVIERNKELIEMERLIRAVAECSSFATVREHSAECDVCDRDGRSFDGIKHAGDCAAEALRAVLEAGS